MSIRKYREKNTMTQVELAKLIEVTQSTIAMWERGETKPRVDKLIQLSKIFNCTIDELLQKEEKENEK